MRGTQLSALSLFFTSAIFLSSAAAQSTSLGLGARFTASDAAQYDPMESVGLSGDTTVAIVKGKAVYVFQKKQSGWTSETQTSELSGVDSFSALVAISGDTVVANGEGSARVFVKPAAGWRSMDETAQLLIGDNGYESVAIDGDTIVVTVAENKGVAAYVFVKPSGGWVTTSTYAAKLTVATNSTPDDPVGAISGDTIVLSGAGAAYVFQKPETGWVTSTVPTATLTAGNSGILGNSVAITSDRIAVGASDYLGIAVDLFVKPPSGWTDATATTVLRSPNLTTVEYNFGTQSSQLAMDDSHLVIGATDHTYVYSQPPSGWAASKWPSQEFVGHTGSYFGTSVAVDGDNVVSLADEEAINGSFTQGAAYLFTLFPNWIQVPTGLVDFQDIDLGNASQIVPVTITNTGTGTLKFTTALPSANFEVLQSGQNTCLAGVPAGQSCVLPIQFDPPGVGVHTGLLTLTSPSSASVRVLTLRGVANGVGAARESDLNFYNVLDGYTETLPLTVANIGVAGSPTITATFNNKFYSLAPGGTCSGGIAAGTTCTLMIQFSPTATGVHNGAVTLTSSSGTVSQVRVTGTGVYH